MKRPIKNAPVTSGAALPNPWQSWPGLFFRQRLDCIVEWASPQWEKFVGHSLEKFKRSAKTFWSLIHPEDLETVSRQIQSSVQNGQAIHHSYRLSSGTPDRKLQISEWRRPLFDPKGKVSGFESFWIDTTRQALAEQRVLGTAWRETLADLTPGLAHDFNNTLTGILGLSEAFLAQIDSEHPFHEGLSLITQKVHHASELVYRLARLHQDKTGTTSYHDLNALTREVIDVLSRVIPKRIEVGAKLTPGPLPIHLDGVELQRVLLTLAMNSANTMPGQGKLLFQSSREKISPSKLQDGEKASSSSVVSLSIADPGDGFVAEQLDAWLNSSTTVAPPLEGPGLAWNQAMSFARKNGGGVSAESKPRVGTTLRIWVPEARLE